jgi:O-antigen/teichoic acid export membrane protein
MGLVKFSKQIAIISQIIYLITAIVFILLRFGLIAIVSAQVFSVISRRVLSHLFVFTQDLKNNLKKAIPQSQKHIFRAIFPNALKIGITALGSFLVSRSAIIIGSLFLSLNLIASYGITIQIIGIIAGIAMVFFSTFQPKISMVNFSLNQTGWKRHKLFYTEADVSYIHFIFIICSNKDIQTRGSGLLIPSPRAGIIKP